MYFKAMPKIFYPTGKGGQTVTTDIFRRVQLDKFFKNRTNLGAYYIPDGMTPELVAKQQYGSTKYHWIVLLANEILDVQREWPKSNEEITLYVKDKYGADNSTDVHHYVLTANKTIVVDWDAVKSADGTYTAVTNRDYEEEVNDTKRQIFILDPIFLSSIVKQFRSLIS